MPSPFDRPSRNSAAELAIARKKIRERGRARILFPDGPFTERFGPAEFWKRTYGCQCPMFGDVGRSIESVKNLIHAGFVKRVL